MEILVRILADTSDTHDFLNEMLTFSRQSKILARMFVSVSVSASWNASFSG